jgi:hypothetical protein
MKGVVDQAFQWNRQGLACLGHKTGAVDRSGVPVSTMVTDLIGYQNGSHSTPSFDVLAKLMLGLQTEVKIVSVRHMILS